MRRLPRRWRCSRTRSTTKRSGKRGIEMGTSKTAGRGASDLYLELVRRFPLRPIRDRGGHQEAKRVLRSLGGERDSAARDYKSVLASLIVDYERDAGQRVDTS